jgi:hypothetical protein
VLRSIFVRKRTEEIRYWRKLYNEKRHSSYPSPSPHIIRMIKIMEDEMGGACSEHKEMKN